MIFSDERVFMNTIVRIQVVSSKGTVFTRKKLEQAFDQFDHVVRNFSRFLPESELSRLNKSGTKNFKVSSELYALIKKALRVAEITGGAYDPTIIDLLETYGYTREQDFNKLNNPSLYKEIQLLSSQRPGFRAVELKEKSSTVKLAKGQRLDLGSIGKGYAIDLAYDVLNNNGFSGFLINAGGDLRAMGYNAEGLPWKIMLFRSQLPNQRLDPKSFLGYLTLENCSIAGSGGWARKVGTFHHLLNPRDGLPINSISQTYVMGATATDCDLWATALFVTGKPALPLLEEEGMAGLLIDSGGNILQSNNFEYYI